METHIIYHTGCTYTNNKKQYQKKRTMMKRFVVLIIVLVALSVANAQQTRQDLENRINQDKEEIAARTNQTQPDTKMEAQDEQH